MSSAFYFTSGVGSLPKKWGEFVTHISLTCIPKVFWYSWKLHLCFLTPGSQAEQPQPIHTRLGRCSSVEKVELEPEPRSNPVFWLIPHHIGMSPFEKIDVSFTRQIFGRLCLPLYCIYPWEFPHVLWTGAMTYTTILSFVEPISKYK